MRDHHRGDVVMPAPTAQRPQREPIRHLDGIRVQVLEQRRHWPGQHGAVAAGERNLPGGQRDPGDSGWQLDPVGVLSGHDQEDVVAGRAVFRAEAIDGRPQAARARPVEVGDLNYPHDSNENRHVCAISDAYPTGVLTAVNNAPRATSSGASQHDFRLTGSRAPVSRAVAE